MRFVTDLSKGILGKPDSTELWSEVISCIPDEVFLRKDVKVLNVAFGHTTEADIIVKRMLSLGRTPADIKDSIYLLDKYSVFTKDAMRKGYTHVIQADFMEWEADMKFDIVIGNPPYQDKKGNENSTNSADLYTKFINKSFELTKDYVAMIIPSAWSGPRNSNIKQTIFEDNQPTIFNTHGKKWFDVEMNTCYFISQKGRQGPTEITDAHGNKIVKTLSKESVITTDLRNLAFKEKIEVFSKKSNLAKNWLRGKIHLNQVDDVKDVNGVELVLSVGSKATPLDNTAKIKIDAETTGFGLHKLVIPNMGSNDCIGNIKFAKKEHVGGHSVVFLVVDKEEELTNLKNYLESKLVRFLIKATKISTPNSKTIFENIPSIDFTKSWTDLDLYNYFGLTQEEIEQIEASY